MADRMVAAIAADLRATGAPYKLAVEAADKLDELVTLLAATETDRDRLAAERDEVWDDWQSTTERLVDAMAERDRLASTIEHVWKVAHVADPDDVNDWQRGWRACSDRILSALHAVGASPSTTCICPHLSDTGGFRIADLACPVHGVGGTEQPGDGPDDQPVPPTRRPGAPTFFERRAARDPSVDHASHSMQWTGPCPECPSPRQENSDG